MSPRVYISGKLVEKADAKISVFDHGLLFGDGVCEGIRAYCGKLFRLAQHVDRLYASARAIRLSIPSTKDELAGAIESTLAANALNDAYVRVILTRGAGSLDLDPRKTTDPQVIVIADQISVYPRELYEHGLKIVTATTTLAHPGSVSSRVGSLSGLDSVLARMEAIGAGCLEALLLNDRGAVAGCTAGSLFVVRGEIIHTPSVDYGFCDEVARDAVRELAIAAGYNVVERPLDRYDIYAADECVLCGTAIALIPVVECDGRVLGSGRPGPIARELSQRFEALVREAGQAG
jgi:branched-chain amino acid aminotransferase